MNIREALTLSDLRTRFTPIDHLKAGQKRTADEISERVFAIAEEQGQRLREMSPFVWKNQWLQSERFVLVDLPLHFAACPRPANDASKVQGCMRAAIETAEPIVVDLNKQRVGQSVRDYYPPVIVVDGIHRHAGYRLQGRETIPAWVGELAAAKLHLFDKKKEKKPGKPRIRVDLEASAEPIRRRIMASAMEQAMQIHALGAGPGGPGASLGNGSGPSLAFKPKPAAGAPTPTMQSKKKMAAQSPDGGGYEGYRKASTKMSDKTKGASGSEMAPKLKGSGYFGYNDASEKERKRMKAPAKSEMSDRKLMHPGDYSSDSDIGQLKGAAIVKRIVTKYKKALRSGYRHAAHELEAVAPPGMEKAVKGLKKHFGEGSSSPFKIAWWMHNKKKSKMAADVDINRKEVDLGERPPKRKNPALAVA